MGKLFSDENIARDRNGEVIQLTWQEATRYCKELGGRMPTTREYAEFRNPEAIVEVADMEKRKKQNGGKLPEGFYEVSALNEDGKADVFFYNNEQTQSPLAGELAKYSFWSSSEALTNQSYAHVFYGWMGGGGGEKEDHAKDKLHAVICIKR